MSANPLQDALDAGRRVREVYLRNGRFYFNVSDVIVHEGVYEVVYEYRGSSLSIFVRPEEVDAVITKAGQS